MKKWREASTLITVAAKSRINNVQEFDLQYRKLTSRSQLSEKSDFHIAALKKVGEETTSPELCVFPGGSISTADSSREWEQIFSRFGSKIDVFSSTVCNDNADLPIFKRGPFEDIPRWVSLRISAIRETFEECGILICKKKNHNDLYTRHLQIDDSDAWRNKVFSDPYEFIKLCRIHDCYPDVQNLILWGNWLTPVNFRKRYDTIFFLTILKEAVPMTPDHHEISSVQWCSAGELLDACDAGEVHLAPPQYYELSRLCNITSLQELMAFCLKKNKMICKQWMPVRIITKDGEVSLFPAEIIIRNRHRSRLE